MPNTIRLHRVLRATPERVYRAFTDADAMAKWLPPNGFTGKVHEMNAKVGGTYRMSFTNFTTGKSHAFGGKYLELVPNERLRYTDMFDDPNLPGEMRTSVALKKVSVGTELEHRARRRARRDSVRGVLSRLAGVAGSAREARGSRDPGLTVRTAARAGERTRPSPLPAARAQKEMRTPTRARWPIVSKNTGFVGYKLPPGAMGGSSSSRLLTTQNNCSERSSACVKSYEPDQVK